MKQLTSDQLKELTLSLKTIVNGKPASDDITPTDRADDAHAVCYTANANAAAAVDDCAKENQKQLIVKLLRLGE